MIINIVRESLNFNRIGSPIKKMGIGQEDNKKFIEETDWYTTRSFHNPDFFKRAKPIDLIRNYKGFPILVYEIDNKRTTKILLYMATSTIDETSAYETKEEAIKYMKKRISNYIRRTGLSERLEFNREGSPIEKIGIGQKEIDRQIIKNTEWNWDIDSVPSLFPNVKKIKFIRNYKGLPILILKDTSSENKPYIGMSIKGFGGSPSKTIEEAEESIKSVIDWKSLS